MGGGMRLWITKWTFSKNSCIIQDFRTDIFNLWCNVSILKHSFLEMPIQLNKSVCNVTNSLSICQNTYIMYPFLIQICYHPVGIRASPYQVGNTNTRSSIDGLTPETRYVISVATYYGAGSDKVTSEKKTLIIHTGKCTVKCRPFHS